MQNLKELALPKWVAMEVPKSKDTEGGKDRES